MATLGNVQNVWTNTFSSKSRPSTLPPKAWGLLQKNIDNLWLLVIHHPCEVPPRCAPLSSHARCEQLWRLGHGENVIITVEIIMANMCKIISVSWLLSNIISVVLHHNKWFLIIMITNAKVWVDQTLCIVMGQYSRHSSLHRIWSSSKTHGHSLAVHQKYFLLFAYIFS